MGIQGRGRQGNTGVGGLMVLVATTFYSAINPIVGLVSLLVIGQLSNLILELLDNLEEDFYDN